MKVYYLVQSGEVFEVPCHYNIEDALYGVLVYGETPELALETARAYDRGEIAADNIWCESCGESHVAIQA